MEIANATAIHLLASAGNKGNFHSMMDSEVSENMKLMKNTLGNGFTIIELMAVVAIVAILLTFAIPGFMNLKDNYQLRSAVNSVFSSIGWARAQAIRLQMPVVVIPDTSKGWAGGWKVCKDPDNKGECTEELRKVNALADTIDCTGASSKVQINPSGMMAANNSICIFKVGEKKRKIYIEMNKIKDSDA